MTENRSLDRRSFIKASLAAGGALLVGFRLPAAGRDLVASSEPEGEFEPNAFIRISKEGRLTVRIGQAEMGQGVLTSFAMIVAEELEIDWEKTSYEPVGADPAFVHPMFGFQGTGGSASIRGFYTPLRKAGASVREILISAAASQWGVEPGTCRAVSGKVLHEASGRSVDFPELFEAAAKLTASAEPKLKDPAEFRLIGKKAKRLDTPEKTNGSAQFGIDVKLPGMLTAQVLRCPVFGGKPSKIDDSAAKKVPGVQAIVPMDYGVGIVADNFWAARKGRQALKVEWENGPNASVTSASIYADFKEAAETGKAIEARKQGDVAAAKGSAAKTVEAEYFTPYLAHATMEPMNCAADVRADGCDIHVGTQFPGFVSNAAAPAAGLKPEQVTVHNKLLGGGFGRRAEMDFVVDAVTLSKAVKKPVKVIWTREDDTQHDLYRPATYNKLSAGLDAGGNVVFWQHRLVNSSIGARFFPGFPADRLDDSSVEGANNIPYEIPNIYVDWVRHEPGIPVGYWRSVGSSHTAFTVECFVDEVAAAAGKDPLEFRLSLLEKDQKKAAVLKLVAEKAEWGKPAGEGIFRGIAMAESFGSTVAEVAEVSVGKNGNVTVHRVVCAVDCGQTVNTDTVAAQMEGGIVYGLTAALYGEIEIEGGAVKQTNFNNYKMLRMREMPKVEVHIVPSTDPPGGVGEPGTPPIAPAVANAIFAATGKRIRKLPINSADLSGG